MLLYRERLDSDIVRITSFMLVIEFGQVLCFPRVNGGNFPLNLQLLRKVPNGCLVAMQRAILADYSLLIW